MKSWTMGALLVSDTSPRSIPSSSTAILEMEPTGFLSFEPSVLSMFPLWAAAFLSAFVGKSRPFTASSSFIARRSKT